MLPATDALLRLTRLYRAAAIACLTLICGPILCCAEGAFPYVAYVTQNETYLRSGPGGNFYPTGQLSAGYAVEVYRHDGDGWCGIRPVEGSFSLAPSHQLRILDSRTAEVIAPNVPARIGSALTKDRKAVQVLLERREMVQLLEPPKPSEPFVKIAPPAGEFRYIAASRLSRTPPTEGAVAAAKWKSNAASSSSIEPAQFNEPTPVNADNPFAHLDAALGNPPAEAPPLAGDSAWRPEAGVAAPPAAASRLANAPDTITAVPGSPAAAQLASPAAAAPGLLTASTADSTAHPASPAAAAGQPRIRFEGLTPPTGPSDSRVAEMQLRLSQIVVQPPTNWQLAALREEAATLLAQGDTPELRDQLRELLERIATFENIQKRYRGTNFAATPGGRALPISETLPASGATAASEQPGMTGQSAEVLARVRNDLGGDPSVTPTPGRSPSLTELAAAPGAVDGNSEAKYDAVGTLKPVVSKRAQAPRFALVDDHGDVVTFVTASPEVNLQAYIGKRIGVLGNRGFMPEYRRAHVTASRVTPLEERLVR
jgi:hypothetical protein